MREINFNITITQTFDSDENDQLLVDLATVEFLIDQNLYQSHNNSVFYLPIDWFVILPSSTNDLLLNETQDDVPILRVPIQIQIDDIQTIIAVTDTTLAFNTAVLSSTTVQYPLRILSMNYSGFIEDQIQAICYTDSPHLQVDRYCTNYYFSGHERGWSGTSTSSKIIYKYGKYLKYLDIRVYMPDKPLRLELSDQVLSRIHGWFVKDRGLNLKEHQYKVGNQQHQIKTTYNNIDVSDDDDENTRCYAVYQQAMIDVYTKFYTVNEAGERVYLFNDLDVLVTSFVRLYMETDDNQIAMIKDGKVVGIGPGKTNVKVYSLSNKLLLGSCAVIVDNSDLIQIKSVSFNVVTGIDLQINLVEQISPHTYRVQAKAILNRLIDDSDKFGHLHIVLNYSDNTSIPLDLISRNQYELDVFLTSDPSQLRPILRVEQSLDSNWQHLRIRPLAIGHTYLLGKIKFGNEQCTDMNALIQRDLSCEIIVSSMNSKSRQKDDPTSGSLKQRTQIVAKTQYQENEYVLMKDDNNKKQQKTQRFIFGITAVQFSLYILFGIFILLLAGLTFHFFVYIRHNQKRRRNSTTGQRRAQSGAEDVNNDWIFLDKNSLELPERHRPTPNFIQSTSPELNLINNPLENRTSYPSLKYPTNSNSWPSSNNNVKEYDNDDDHHEYYSRPKKMNKMNNYYDRLASYPSPWLTHGMTYEETINYFDNLKESHA